MKSEQKKYFYPLIYIGILFVASFPLARGVEISGTDASMWLARVEEMKEYLKQGVLALYPSAELVEYYGGQGRALDTNLWMLFPMILSLVGIGAESVYRIFMLCLQIGTLLSAWKLFNTLFQEKVVAVVGVLLYMTCPYRWYLCYDKGDIERCVAWMLIPLLIWGFYGYAAKRELKYLVAAVLTLAGIGYADNVMVWIVMGIAVLGSIWYRKLRLLAPVVLGGLLYLPGGLRFIKYLLMGATDIANMPVETIMGKGYMPGRFFTVFFYPKDLPGLGAGLLCGVLLFLWLLASGEKMPKQKYSFAGAISVLLLCLSLEVFPWDLVQRAGGPLFRLISLINSPNIFFGLACVALCVLAAGGIEGIVRKGKEKNGFI